MRKWWNKLFISVLFCFTLIFISNTAFSQFSDNDLLLIEKHDFHDRNFDKHKVTYMFKSSERKLVKYNPISLVLGTLMLFYQGVVSPQFAAGCLYETSCSNFSQMLIAEYGIFKGVFTSADRLMRCTNLATIDINRLKIDTHSGKVHEHTDVYKLKTK